MLSRIAVRRPRQQRVAPNQVSASVNVYESAIRQRTQLGLIRDLFSPIDSRRVQFQIHFIGERRVSLLTQTPPRISESVVAFSAALGAGPVPGGERGSFVEEEQFRITSLGHYFPIAASEFKKARDPAPAFVVAHDFPGAVV